MRNVATQEIHRFYQSLGFIQVHTPVLTSNDCEGAGEVFHIMPGIQASGPRKNTPDTTDNSTPLMFFDTPAYLTVSGQLHLEAVASGMSKVYAFNTAFRAENCQSRRHMSEFYMVEAELAFLSSLDDLMQNVEDLVKTTVKRMLETCESDLTLFFQHLSPKGHKEQVQKMLSSEFKRMTYTDAIGILRGQPGLKSKAEWGDDLSNEQEQCLVKQAGGLPVFVTDWPASAKPFYMRPNPDGKTVACFDLLVPDVGELCGGSLREDDLDRLEAKVAKLGQADALSWYVDLRRYGATPTGGYGLGFERHLQWILGINNIKDTIPFPRWTHHCRM
ncbi:PREDICTED: probable asparagine--tRNA ligase, mitochondrial isoform X2 [Priapulus caudatus]|nr:PREDICTED: probable asparagine--tRNA ligase, mitochondrial isoform X2 [Priapulus caudatus]